MVGCKCEKREKMEKTAMSKFFNSVSKERKQDKIFGYCELNVSKPETYLAVTMNIDAVLTKSIIEKEIVMKNEDMQLYIIEGKVHELVKLQPEDYIVPELMKLPAH